LPGADQGHVLPVFLSGAAGLGLVVAGLSRGSGETIQEAEPKRQTVSVRQVLSSFLAAQMPPKD